MPAHRVLQHRRCETPELGGGECHLCLGARDGPCEVAGFHRPRGRLSGRFFYPFPYRRQDLGRAAQCVPGSPRRFREVAFIRQNRAQTVRDWQRRLAQRLCPSQRQCRPICRQNGAGRKTGLAPQFGRSWRRYPSALGWRRRRRRGAHRWACSCSGSSRAQHRRRFADRGGQRLEPGQGCTEPKIGGGRGSLPITLRGSSLLLLRQSRTGNGGRGGRSGRHRQGRRHLPDRRAENRCHLPQHGSGRNLYDFDRTRCCRGAQNELGKRGHHALRRSVGSRRRSRR